MGFIYHKMHSKLIGLCGGSDPVEGFANSGERRRQPDVPGHPDRVLGDHLGLLLSRAGGESLFIYNALNVSIQH